MSEEKVELDTPNLDKRMLDLAMYAIRAKLNAVELEEKRLREVTDNDLKYLLSDLLNTRKKELQQLQDEGSAKLRERRAEERAEAEEKYRQLKIQEAKELLKTEKDLQ